MARAHTPTGVPTSTTVVQTPNVTRIRELMDQALQLLDPLEFRFTVARFGSLDAAKSRATSLQNQFNSIRARTRNATHAQIGRKNVEDNGEQIRGPYDDLACNKHMLPDGEGYIVVMGRAPPDEFEVYNHRTGERLMYQDPREKRTDQLLNHWTQKLFSKAPKPWFTYEQERELYELNPELFRNIYETSNVPLPTWLTELRALQADGPSIDILNTSMDDFGVSADGEV